MGDIGGEVIGTHVGETCGAWDILHPECLDRPAAQQGEEGPYRDPDGAQGDENHDGNADRSESEDAEEEAQDGYLGAKDGPRVQELARPQDQGRLFRVVVDQVLAIAADGLAELEARCPWAGVSNRDERESRTFHSMQTLTHNEVGRVAQGKDLGMPG